MEKLPLALPMKSTSAYPEDRHGRREENDS